jgi:catechol 2,3-dioxygenase-like lactoylglutathione lyase family enzyme
MATNVLSSLKADHVMIGVSNFEETMQWYKEKLGFREERRWTVKELPGVQLAYLELNGFRIEIVGGGKGRDPSIPSNFAEHIATKGYAHLCFRVDDVDAVMAELKQRGVPTFVPAEDYPQGAERRVGFIRDNNNNVIEFAGPLKGIEPTHQGEMSQ